MGGINLILSAIVVKNYRVYRIFNNIYSNKLAIRDVELLKHAGILFLLLMIGPVIYMAVARPRVAYVSIEANKSAYVCASANESALGAFAILMAIPTFLVLCAAGFLAYKTRGVLANWNEAKAISIVVYNLIFIALLYVTTTVLNGGMYRTSTIIQDVVILYGGFVCLAALFGPKVIEMLKQRRMNRRHLRLCLSETRITIHSHEDVHGGDLGTRSTRTSIVGDLHGEGGGRGRDGLPARKIQALDPDIAFSKETGEELTFEEFEGRLNETTAAATAVTAIVVTTPTIVNNNDSSGNINANSFPQRSATYPQMFIPAPHELYGSLSLEYRTSTCDAGPESYSLSPSPNVSISGGRTEPNTMYNPVGLNLERSEGIGPVALINNSIISSSSSGKNYNDFRMGIFSFGNKDNTQTIIVVSSLNMVILNDGCRSRSKTYIYTMAEPLTESGHYYLCVSCLNNRFLQIEFPNAVARDQWSRIFNATDGRNPNRRVLETQVMVQGPVQVHPSITAIITPEV
ncbi:hypothetical protein BGX33_003840 [Mortierella sp. NVP41]|nr:hypothetical protein BGX33_003840 [Mortierella sp. NVP41]